MADDCWSQAFVYPVGWEPKGTCSPIPQCTTFDRSTSVACNAQACLLIAGVGDSVEEEVPTYCPVRA